MRKRNVLRTLISGLLISSVITLSIGDIRIKADTSQPDTDEVVEELFRQLSENADKDAFAFRSAPVRKRLLRSAQLPESYDLRDPNGDGSISYVTSVKSQSPFSTCWGFAATAAAETSIIGSGFADNTLDLSEKHTIFFSYRPVIDDDNSQNGEGFHFKGEDGSSDIYDNGSLFYATGLYASGAGPVKESDNPDFVYRGKNGYHNDDSYLADDNWWIDDSHHFRQDYILKESHILPNSSDCLINNKPTEFEAVVKAMKEELKAGRGLQINYKASNALPGEPNKQDYFNEDNWAHYTYKAEGINHSVEIIGWDDNYPRENFVHPLTDGNSPAPEGDGAWLVKNSWGSEENEFPNRDGGDWGLLNGQDKGVYNEETREWEYRPVSNAKHTGYFWLSYYDLSIDHIEALEFESAKTDNYCIAQYDYMPVQDVFANFVSYELSMANVFKTGDFTGGNPAYVNAVSCQTFTPGTEVYYRIYRLKDGTADPVDGDLVAEKRAAYSYGGYHKERLDTPVRMNSNDRFSVVVTQVTPDGKYAISVQTSRKDWPKFTVMGVVNEGESLMLMPQSGELKDYSKYNDYFEGRASDNFPIKAFLTLASDEPVPGGTPPTPIAGLIYDREEHALVEAGSAPEGCVMTYGLADENGEVHYSTEIPKAAKAGGYRIYYKVTKDGKDIEWGDVEATIGKKMLSADWGYESSWKYDGTSHGPAITITGICQGDDVSPVLEGYEAINAGSYTAQITGLSGYDNENYDLPREGLTCDYEITKRQVTLTSGNEEAKYTGNPVTCDEVVETGDGFVNGEGVTCTVTGERTEVGISPNTFTYEPNEGTNEGNYDITITFGRLRVWWTDEDVQDHVVTVTAKEKNTVYDGTTQSVSGLVDGCDHFTVGDEDYTITGLSAEGSGVNVGTYPVTISGTATINDSAGNDVSSHFRIEKVNGTLTITARDISDASVRLNNSLIYTGSEQTQEITVGVGGRVLTKDVDYTVTGDKAASAGEHTLTITGKGNYKGSVTQKYTITMPELTGISVSQKDTLTYNGNSQVAGIKWEAGQTGVTFTFARTEDGTYTTGLPGFKEAGEHTVYYKAEKPGYVTKTGSFTVNIKKAVIGISWKNTRFTYDGNDHVPTAVATNVKGSDSLTLEVSGAASQVGTHTARVTGINGSGAENYELPSDVEKSFEIVGSSTSSSSSSSSSSSGSSDIIKDTTVNSGSSASSGSSTKNTGGSTAASSSESTVKNTSSSSEKKTSDSTAKNTAGSTPKNTAGSTSNGTANKSTNTTAGKNTAGNTDNKSQSDKKDASGTDKNTGNTAEDSPERKADLNAKGSAKLSNDNEALKAILGEEKYNELKEAGKLPGVRLDVSVPETVSESDKKITEEAVEKYSASKPDLKIGQYLDLKLGIMEGDKFKNIEKTDKPVRVVIDAPGDIVGKAKSMSVLKIHDGEDELLEDQDDDPETVTIDTDGFSTYVLLYQEKSDGLTEEASEEVKTVADTGDTGIEETNIPDDTPEITTQSLDNAGQDSPEDGMWRLWVIGGVLILAAIAIFVVCFRASRKTN